MNVFNMNYSYYGLIYILPDACNILYYILDNKAEILMKALFVSGASKSEEINNFNNSILSLINL